MATVSFQCQPVKYETEQYLKGKAAQVYIYNLSYIHLTRINIYLTKLQKHLNIVRSMQSFFQSECVTWANIFDMTASRGRH